MNKNMKDTDSSVIVELPHNSNSITQNMTYRQFLKKYAEQYSVSRASWKYNKSRLYIYFWKARWDRSMAYP